MSGGGHGIEEGILRDIHSPAHRERAPATVALAVLGFGAGGGAFYLVDLPVWAGVLLAALVAAPFLALAAYLNPERRRWKSEARGKFAAIDRKERAAESRFQVKQARASGDFDRWEGHKP